MREKAKAKAKAKIMYKILNKKGPGCSQIFLLVKVRWQITNFGAFPVDLVYHNLELITMVLAYGTLFETKLGSANHYHVFEIKLLLTFFY